MFKCLSLRNLGGNGARLNSGLLYDDGNLVEYLPNFVACSSAAKLRSIGLCCGPDKGPQLFTFTSRWTDSSKDPKRKWHSIVHSLGDRATLSDSLHHLKSCERCGRLGCDQTLGEDNETSQKLCYVCLGKVLSKAGRKRGSSGAFSKAYRRDARLRSANSSAAGSDNKDSVAALSRDKLPSDDDCDPNTELDCTQSDTEEVRTFLPPVPTELLQIRIIILQKIDRTIVRSKIEFELPSDFKLSLILDAVEERLGDTDALKIYYSTRPIRSKKDLVPIVIKSGDKATLASIAEEKRSLYFVVATRGVRVFRTC